MPHRLGHVDQNSPWARGRLGNFTGGQRARKLRNQGRAGRDPQISQWDWLYGGFFPNASVRPPSYAPSGTREGRNTLEQLTGFGYSPQEGTAFNPAAGTLGGVRPFAGVSSVVPPTGGAGAPGSLAKYRGDILGDLYKRRRFGGMRAGTSGRRAGEGGQATDFGGPLTDQQEANFITGGGGFDTPGGRRNVMRSSDPRGNRGTFGPQEEDMFQSLDPLSRAIRLGTQEAQLSSFGQNRALLNLGIFGPGGMQSILEQAEGPENALLANLPGQTAEQLGFNQQQGAEARRRALRGASAQLGRVGAQRPGVAASIAASSAIPGRQAEAQRAFEIQQRAQDLENQIGLGQGGRRADLLRENMLSKIQGLAGLSGAARTGAGMLGPQLMDPTNPLQNQFDLQSGLMNEQLQNQFQLNRQTQGFQRAMEFQRNYWTRANAQQMTRLRLWFESEMEKRGLGEYADDDDAWAAFADAVKDGAYTYATRGQGG